MINLNGITIIGIIILIFFVHIHYQSHMLHSLLSGFWEADVSFCEESGLDLFCLYLDEDYDMFGSRACYILASQDNTIVLNEPTVANITFSWFTLSNFYPGMDAAKYFNVSFKSISKEAEDTFPKYQKIRFYPICNKIVLYYDNTITAVLYKNPVNTELKSILKE